MVAKFFGTTLGLSIAVEYHCVTELSGNMFLVVRGVCLTRVADQLVAFLSNVQEASGSIPSITYNGCSGTHLYFWYLPATGAGPAAKPEVQGHIRLHRTSADSLCSIKYVSK